MEPVISTYYHNNSTTVYNMRSNCTTYSTYSIHTINSS